MARVERAPEPSTPNDRSTVHRELGKPHTRTFIVALLLLDSFISDSEHSQRVVEARALTGEDVDGTGPEAVYYQNVGGT